MDERHIKDTTALAFLGDALYELYVRHRLILGSYKGADRLHGEAVKYVRAEAQAFAIKSMQNELSEDELALVKRARNKKISSKPKNADPLIYKWATAFEALLAYLYLTGQEERMVEIINTAMEKTEEENGKK